MTTAQTVDRGAERAAPAELLGHPIGLSFLFTTEMWERFSYYGMRSFLVLYLTNFLLLEPTSSGVLGYGAMKSLFEGITGPLNVQQYASMIYGTYTALVYLTPVFGGMIA